MKDDCDHKFVRIDFKPQVCSVYMCKRCQCKRKLSLEPLKGFIRETKIKKGGTR